MHKIHAAAFCARIRRRPTSILISVELNAGINPLVDGCPPYKQTSASLMADCVADVDCHPKSSRLAGTLVALVLVAGGSSAVNGEGVDLHHVIATRALRTPRSNCTTAFAA